MSTTVTLEQAQAHLAELIDKLTAGDEVVITRENKPVAKIVPAAQQPERKLGTLKGSVRYMAPDFDAPLDDFKEYMG